MDTSTPYIRFPKNSFIIGDTYLTPREKEILSFLISGFSCPEIAEKEVISIKTVQKHCANMLLKTESRRMIQVAWLAFKAGFEGMND